jgi:hypothetical protein
MDEEIRNGIARDAPEGGQTTSAPDLGALLGSLLGGGNGAGENGASSDALRDGIGAVLSDPQMMATLPGMMEMLRPLMGGGAGGDTTSEKTEKTAQEAVTLSVAGKGQGGCHDRRVALLRALRPYMSDRRREAIDYILRMDQMGKMFRGG